ncbi:hypothetical protein CYMTET_20680 [Cymbomonas tetramitiformis]|uniref:Uncharacterized protein n=1 Tax=Cymbomonas tetramitiformis TaxID=36881 RepID=A0AAE0L3M7_9CHLO|nr:hypothetical protein CYMTET_20680 [Cymbomonas tetramitiformis]
MTGASARVDCGAAACPRWPTVERQGLRRRLWSAACLPKVTAAQRPAPPTVEAAGALPAPSTERCVPAGRPWSAKAQRRRPRERAACAPTVERCVPARRLWSACVPARRLWSAMPARHREPLARSARRPTVESPACAVDCERHACASTLGAGVPAPDLQSCRACTHRGAAACLAGRLWSAWACVGKLAASLHDHCGTPADGVRAVHERLASAARWRCETANRVKEAMAAGLAAANGNEVLLAEASSNLESQSELFIKAGVLPDPEQRTPWGGTPAASPLKQPACPESPERAKPSRAVTPLPDAAALQYRSPFLRPPADTEELPSSASENLGRDEWGSGEYDDCARPGKEEHDGAGAEGARVKEEFKATASDMEYDSEDEDAVNFLVPSDGSNLQSATSAQPPFKAATADAVTAHTRLQPPPPAPAQGHLFNNDKAFMLSLKDEQSLTKPKIVSGRRVDMSRFEESASSERETFFIGAQVDLDASYTMSPVRPLELCPSSPAAAATPTGSPHPDSNAPLKKLLRAVSTRPQSPPPASPKSPRWELTFAELPETRSMPHLHDGDDSDDSVQMPLRRRPSTASHLMKSPGGGTSGSQQLNIPMIFMNKHRAQVESAGGQVPALMPQMSPPAERELHQAVEGKLMTRFQYFQLYRNTRHEPFGNKQTFLSRKVQQKRAADLWRIEHSQQQLKAIQSRLPPPPSKPKSPQEQSPQQEDAELAEDANAESDDDAEEAEAEVEESGPGTGEVGVHGARPSREDVVAMARLTADIMGETPGEQPSAPSRERFLSAKSCPDKSFAYLSTCSRLGMSPFPVYQPRHPDPSHLKLDNQGMGDAEIVALAESLLRDADIKTLNLSHNRIGMKGYQAIGRLLAERPDFEQLLLSKSAANSTLGSHLAAALSSLSMSQCLRTLHLEDVGLGDQNVSTLMVALRTAKSRLKSLPLHTISLARNKITKVGAAHLAEMLYFCSQLRELDVSWNNIRGTGAELLATAIGYSQLNQVNLSWNTFGDGGGAELLGSAFETNTCLTYVDLSRNNIRDNACMVIASGIRENEVLQVLSLQENPLGFDGASYLSEILGETRRWRLQQKLPQIEIDLKGCSFGSASAEIHAQFDPEKPNKFYRLDLSKPFDRTIVRRLQEMAAKEQGENWQGECINGKPFDYDEAMLDTYKWPECGILELTYTSTPVLPTVEGVMDDSTVEQVIAQASRPTRHQARHPASLALPPARVPARYSTRAGELRGRS